MLVSVPVLWGFVRRTEGLPFMGAPTIGEIEGSLVTRTLRRTPRQ